MCAWYMYPYTNVWILRRTQNRSVCAFACAWVMSFVWTSCLWIESVFLFDLIVYVHEQLDPHGCKKHYRLSHISIVLLLYGNRLLVWYMTSQTMTVFLTSFVTRGGHWSKLWSVCGSRRGESDCKVLPSNCPCSSLISTLMGWIAAQRQVSWATQWRIISYAWKSYKTEWPRTQVPWDLFTGP